MKDKLREGDLILINKTLYSGFLAKTLVTVGFTGQVKRNDILVFKKDVKEQDYFIKRCIGLPRESIGMRDGVLIIDHKTVSEVASVRKWYRIYYNEFRNLSDKMHKLDIKLYQQGFNRNALFFNIPLNEEQKAILLKYTEVDSISLHGNDQLKNKKTKTIDPRVYNLSEIVVPFRGMTILTDQKNFTAYKELIERYEKVKISREGDYYTIDGKIAGTYTFTRDYLFLLGDNRNDSIDSRFFGFIPMQNITGKYICRL